MLHIYAKNLSEEPKMDEGKLQKGAKSISQLQRELPKIIRESERIRETVEARVAAEYLTLYVPVLLIDEAKKELSDAIGNFSYEQPHNLTREQYRVKYDLVAHKLLDVYVKLWEWFGKNTR